MHAGPFIRVRDRTGKVTEIPDGQFVEICDETGLIGALVYRSNAGTIKVVQPDDLREVEFYSKLFNVKFCRSVKEIRPVIHDNRQ